MAEYEALLLGLKLVKSLQAIKVSILGDSDLVIQQVKGNFVTNDKRLRSYRSAAAELLNSFTEFQLPKFLEPITCMLIVWLHLQALVNFLLNPSIALQPR